MKHPVMRSLCSILLVLSLMIGSLPIAVMGADDTIYINSAGDTVNTVTDSLYAVGGENQTNPLSEEGLYAITGSGVTKVGDTASDASTDSTATPEPSATPTPSPTPEPDTSYTDVPVAYNTVKVGLYYGSTALEEADLSSMTGFRFGYYDNNRIFHEIGSTNVTNITLLPDWNWTTTTGVTIGCYHILRTGSFQTYAEAKAEADRIGGFPAYYSGSFFVNYGHYWYPQDGETAMLNTGITGNVTSQSNRCIVVTETGTNRILFEFDCGSSAAFAVEPISGGEKTAAALNGLQYYGGFQFARLSGDQYMTAVNYVDIEDYTKGVIPYEMYVTWPLEALKAQALCARNYAVTNFNRYRAQGFDVTADVYSQVYKGIGDATAETNAAVDATAGKYIRYEGNLCQTFFFSSDGGATESSEYVWGAKVPYLLGVEDPYEDDVETYAKSWTYVCKPTELQTMVNERESVNLDIIKDVDCSYTAMGNMKSITFTDVKDKTHTVTGNRCNYVMGAKSQRFKITMNDDGNFVVTGSGWGHNCGMSQYGAYSMAKHHGKTAEEIIKFYYTGVYIR